MTRRTGFTLVELLVVIALIGTMAGLFLPSMSRAREKSRQTRCMTNLRQIGQAALIYHDDHGTLPTTDYSGYLMWNGEEYLLYARLLKTASGKSMARAFFCPSSKVFSMRDRSTGIQNLGVPGRVTAGTYYTRSRLEGAPSILGSDLKSLLADLYEETDRTRNHQEGANVLYSDGSVRFADLPRTWRITAPEAWDQLDQWAVSAIP